MPKSWYDWHAVMEIDDPEVRALYLSVLADKKPYFMMYIYPDLMRKYKKYVNGVESKAWISFGMSIDDMESVPEEERTDEQREFLKYHRLRMPVGDGDCVINRICWRLENECDGLLKRRRAETKFDYVVLKSDAEYTKRQSEAVARIYAEYNKQMRKLVVENGARKCKKDDLHEEYSSLREQFVRKCLDVCSDMEVLCNAMIDVCYKSDSAKGFVWDICGEQILQNLLAKNENRILWPQADEDGDVHFGGESFRFVLREVESER